MEYFFIFFLQSVILIARIQGGLAIRMLNGYNFNSILTVGAPYLPANKITDGDLFFLFSEQGCL